LNLTLLTFVPERLKQSYPPYNSEGEAAAAAGQTFRHRKTLLVMIIVQAGINGSVTMTGYIWSVTFLHIRVGIWVFSKGKADSRHLFIRFSAHQNLSTTQNPTSH